MLRQTRNWVDFRIHRRLLIYSFAWHPIWNRCVDLGNHTKKIGGKKLALLGGAGILVTLALYGSLFYFGFAKTRCMYDELRTQCANSLNTLVQAVNSTKFSMEVIPSRLKLSKSRCQKTRWFLSMTHRRKVWRQTQILLL